jgi:hypothetical protein
VVLFGANLRVRNCEAEGCPSHRCSKNGPHLHYNGNVHHIVDNAEKYIRPLQAAGMRVILGTLPDHDNFTYHSLGPWFGQAIYSWTTTGNPGVAFHSNWWTGPATEYPLGNETVINAFIEELVSEIERIGLDGFDIDDEWATSGIWNNVRGVSTRPGDYAGSGANAAAQNTARDEAITRNIANFIYRARIRMDRDLPTPLPPLADRKIISLYRFGAPRTNMVSTATFGPGTIPGITGTPLAMSQLWTFLSYGNAAIYPEWLTSNWFGAAPPRAQYSPAASGFHNWSLHDNALSSTANYRGTNPWRWKCWYGMNSGTIEQNVNHISRFSTVVYNQRVIYVGPDYPQDWAKW